MGNELFLGRDMKRWQVKSILSEAFVQTDGCFMKFL
jgi:hypothetical protein